MRSIDTGYGMLGLSNDANYRYYDTEGVPELLGRFTTLFKAEQSICSSLMEEIRDQPLLEIGIGAGRVSPYLRSISNNYIGIDYSERMVARCKIKMPDATLFVADARNMPMFSDGQFAAVFFLWNGIDSVNPTDRKLILREINRILRQRNGVFIFSTHNLDWWLHYPLRRFCRLRSLINPVSFMKNNAGPFKVYASGLLNRFKNKLSRLDYAIILEYEQFMVLPIHYIGIKAQTEQLMEAGFDRVETVGVDGLPADDQSRVRDYLLHYVARKVQPGSVRFCRELDPSSRQK